MSDEQGVIRRITLSLWIVSLSVIAARRGQSTALNFTITAFRTVGMGFTLYYFGDD